MTVTIDGNTIIMTGVCSVDEVEALVGFLESQPDSVVDLAGATAIHAAHWQAMMVFRPKISWPLTSDRILSSLFMYYKGFEP